MSEVIKLSELERLQLENANLKLNLIQKELMELNRRTMETQNEGSLVIQKFCNEHKLDIKNTSVDIPTGIVTILEDKKEVQDADVSSRS